ncbi:MAG: alpha-2-macroglobulin family protein [Proteobacteria bacterium]|nr:alpha-2-macroglobulin family protein [Pseudomonadota bacterium]
MRALLGLVFLVVSLLSGPAFAQKTYLRDDLGSNGIRLEEAIRKSFAGQVQGRSVQQLRQDAQAAFAHDPRRALALYGAAVAADGKSASSWLGYSRAALAIEPRDGGERYRLRDQAVTAAYMAYLVANARSEEATGLAALGEAYVAGENWRPALNAFRASLGLGEQANVRRRYQDLREQHGFRVAESDPYKVDSDASTPRICIQFTEALQRGKVDFAPYVAVAGANNVAVSAEDRNLCIDGLKHGERYTVLVRQGLPSDVGENLLKSADFDIYVRDRSAQVRFSGRNYVLPRVGQEGIPVVSVNTPKVAVQISRIGDRSLLPTVRSDNFMGQLDAYQARRIANETGAKVWSGTMDVKVEQNRDVTTAFPVLEAVGKLEPGVYVMTAWPDGATGNDEDSYETRATQWFVVSDLGLTAVSGREGVNVFARSLASAKPLGGLDLKLVARNNEILASMKTDSNGFARFAPGLSRGSGGLEPGMVVASDASGDYGFLDLQQTAFDLTDRGVKGRAAAGALDAFIFAERGVYRSTETVHLTTLLRNARGQVDGDKLPLTLVVQRPDGVEFKRASVADQGLGGRALSVTLPEMAARGVWRVRVFADPKGAAIGETSFQVEDYIPERLKVELTARQDGLNPGQPAEIDVAADFLYGAPGANLTVSGEVSVRLSGKGAVPGFPDFMTGLDDEAFEPTSAEIEDKGLTDAKGRVTMTVPVPEVSAPRAVEARITLRVGEEGGRAVERSLTLPIRPQGPVLAVKKLFEDSALTEGSLANFDVLALTPDGRKLARNRVEYTLSRMDRRYQWFNQDGRWSFEAIKSTRKLRDGTVDITADAAGRVSVPVELGQYRLDLKAPDLAPVSMTFSVGWAGEGTASTPDILEMQLDKARYAAGESMTVKLNPRFAGTATIAVVADGVTETRVIDIAREGGSLSLPVKAEWGAGAYVVALAHRPLDQTARRMPGRSLGVAWFGIDGAGRKLDVNLALPERVRPRDPLKIPVTLAGLAAGEEAYVTVAAVDVGILNLTRYETPDPSGYFFGQRQISDELRDLYGYLIDGMQGTRGAIRSGGDAAMAKLDGAPPTQAPLARYSGVVKVGPDGKAEVTFDLPAFNGTVRVMAAAWSRHGVGQASREVIVRDPVVVAGTLPRFMNFGDSSRFFIEVNNLEGAAGTYTLDLDVKGPVIVAADALRKVVQLQPGGKTALVIPVKAGGLGTATLSLRMTGPNIDITQDFNLTTLPGTPELIHRQVRSLQPNQSVTLTPDLTQEFLPGTGMVSVAVSQLGGIDVPALLGALDRYPYGCTEQTVSRALPLLYVNKLARSEALGIDPDVDGRVRAAIETVLSRQDSNGAFGLWQAGGADDFWLDAFVADFLTRARERSFAVPQKVFDITLDRLRNSLANASDVRGGGEDLAYAAYVLARNGRPVMNDLRYLADTKLSAFKTPLARAQLAAALAMLGDRGRAGTVINAAVELLASTGPSTVSRADYGSKLRDGAGLIALAAEGNLSREVVQKAAAIVSDARGATRLTSTQENAWMVLAAEALANDAQGQQLTVNGQAHQGSLYRSYLTRTLEAGPVTITNAGSAPVEMVVSAAGNPIQHEPPLAAGFRIERSLHKLDGTKLDGTTVRQTDRMVVVLKVTEPDAKYGRLLLVDMLPAGFEIDNPQLVEGGSMAGFSWLKRDAEPANVEYRDDRFVAAFNRDGGKGSAEFSVAYVVRAVAPGTYVQPPAVIEDMYRPERFGRTDYRSVTVQPVR